MNPTKVSFPFRIGLALAIASAAGFAEEPGSSGATEALEILKKVDRAVKAVQAVEYEASVTSSGVAVRFAPSGEGEALMVGWKDGMPARFLARVAVAQPDGESVNVVGGGDGDSYFLIDHTRKKAYEDMDPGVMGSYGGLIRGFGMIEFVHPAPFDDELGAERVELRDETKIDGEPCHQIHVVYAGGQGQSTWFVSKNDYLPRRRIRHISTPRGEGAIEINVTRLDTAPQENPRMFKLELPEGYERVDDFAP